MIHFRHPLPGIDRPQMEADVVIIGGGPAGMACALRLSQLIDKHNLENADVPLSKENIYVLEKAREIGGHCLSGGLLDPQPVDESEQRLSGDRPEHAMEVERGEGGHPGQCRQRQLVGEMAADMIDHAIDTCLVLEPMSTGQGSGRPPGPHYS